jgi:uncharacterized protein YggE
MKKFYLIALALLVAVGIVVTVDMLDLTASKVSAETVGDSMSVVSVSGEGVILVKPDLAYINVGVQTRDENASVAQADNKERMTAVITALKEAGIKDGDLVTTNYNIYRTYDYNKPYMEGTEQPMIYQVDNTVRITIRNVDSVGDMIDTAFNAGANAIENIQFDISNRAEYYDDALVLAMKNAKDKANAIMGTFGEKADKPHKVYEASYTSAPYTNTYFEKADMAVASTPVQAGELAIKANLTVEYGY